MLKVRARRSCLPGGLATKVAPKDKGFKRMVLTALVQEDGRLIASVSKKHKKEPLRQITNSLAVNSEVGIHDVADSASVVRPESPYSSAALASDFTSREDPQACNITADERDSGSSVPCTEAAAALPCAPATDSPTIDATGLRLVQLRRCSTNLSEVEADLQPPEADGLPINPHLNLDDGDGDDNTTSGDDLGILEFDPFLFIKRLPRLEDVVSPFRPALLPKQTRRSSRVTLVLDLDETLVHSTMDICSEADFTFPVEFNNSQHRVYVKTRPHMHEFLSRVSQLFEVMVFTASQSIYADKLLDILDPERQLVHHRAFRDSCVFVEGNYLKDLTVLGRDMAKVAIVDNSPQAFGFQVENGIPIVSWFDDKEDRELLELLPFLEELAGADDVRPILSARYSLSQRVEKAGV